MKDYYQVLKLFIALHCILPQCVPTSGAAVHKLPPILRSEPSLEDYDLATRLSGTIDNVSGLRQMPRAVMGYLSEKDWALVELSCMMYASWRHVSSIAYQQYGYKIDLFVFSDARWSPEASQICEPLALKSKDNKEYRAMARSGPQCFVIRYPPPPNRIWESYPFINNVHFFADPLVSTLLVNNYGYVMKTDFDAFLSPSFADHFPNQFETGYMEYIVVPSTGARLKKIAAKLGLRHAGKQNIGPTWYGDSSSVIAMGNLSIPIMYRIYRDEFDHRPEGGLVQNWLTGEGWPEWSGGGIAMYATELAVNHIFENVVQDKRYDHHGDSVLPVTDVMQIHCRHGDGDFSKFDFYKHHYDAVDLTDLDTSIIRDYATWVAASTWRQMTQQTNAQKHTEL